MLDNLLANPKKILIAVGAFVGGILIIVIISTLLNSGSGNSQVTPPQSSINAELTWWKTDQDEDVYRDVIRDFRKDYPGIKIEVVEKDFDDRYYDDILAQSLLETGPDIYTIRNDDLPAYKDFMTPISFFQGEALNQYKSNFVDLAVRDTTDRDAVYGITSQVDTLQLYYNKDMLSQAGIALPPQTWNDLQSQLSKLNELNISRDEFNQSAISLGTGNRGVTVLDRDRPNIVFSEDIIAALIFQNGGQIYDYRTGSSAIKTGDDTELFEALDFYLSFANPLTSRYSWNNNQKNNIEAFAQEEVAYIIGYSSIQSEIEELNPLLDYEVSQLPQLEGGDKKTFGRFYMDGMSRQLRESENQNKRKAAEAFLYYLSTPEAQELIASKSGMPGARRDVIQKQINNTESRVGVFAAGALYAENYYKPDVVKTENLWNDLFYKVHYQRGNYSKTGDRSEALEKALVELDKEYDIILQQGPRTRD